ncbi:tripartite tricarboxylate transporter substrate binding protein [Pantoea sp. 18069]|uniref:Bug family tripartite tricarboxylate transporter substrate binding protein n=1 Tax=Pantoea sp. 18069 TaxID=2681415 RepID=UPI00135B8D6D|nr:tripartite tricarboxylate transporter substrate binding protein [Pantoea sp. 18069]
MQRRHFITTSTALAALGTFGSAGSLAQGSATSYPSRPVKIAVGFPAGQATDLIARVLTDRLTASMNQPFLVENRPGQGGSLALGYLAQQAADGYNIAFANTGAVLTNQFLQKKLSYKPEDIQPVMLMGDIPLVLVARPGAPFQDLKGMIEFARKHPGRLTYSTPGNGTTSHLAMESIKQAAKVDLMHVPYTGSARSLTDLIAGNVDVSFDTITTVQPFIDAKKLKALAVGTEQRITSLGNVPTLAETGYTDLIGSVWIGAFAPRGTPKAVVDQLESTITAIVQEPATRARLLTVGFFPRLLNATAFEKMLREDAPKVQQIVKISGASVD